MNLNTLSFALVGKAKDKSLHPTSTNLPTKNSLHPTSKKSVHPKMSLPNNKHKNFHQNILPPNKQKNSSATILFTLDQKISPSHKAKISPTNVHSSHQEAKISPIF
jgi:hypothetical protein